MSHSPLGSGPSLHPALVSHGESALSLTILIPSTDFRLLHLQTAWFLTPDERVIAIERLKSNQTSLGSSKVNWSQIREVFDPRLDPQGWLLFIWITANEVVK